MDKLTALTKQEELLELEVKVMRFDFKAYEKIKHIFDKRNDELKEIIYGKNN